MAQDAIKLEKVLKQLNLSKSQCKLNLVTSKKLPNSPNKVILVIPEIDYEDEHTFALNSHILIVDSKTSKIINRFFEISDSNGWESDAIVLSKISIDTAPYYLSNEKRAFGIRVSFNGSSKAYPWGYETISLFEPPFEGQSNNFKRLLKNYKVEEYSGHWDCNCTGEFHSEKKILIITDKLTNSYSSILVKSKIIDSVTFINKYNNCDARKTISSKTKILKYEEGKYKEYVL